MRTPSKLGWIAAAFIAALALVPLKHAWSQADDLGHGWAVPFLIAYLWWERWGQRPAFGSREKVSPRGWLAAALLVLLALPLRLLLTPFALWPAVLALYLAVLVAAALGGAWLAAGAAGVRWVGGPLIILAGAVPWPSLLEANFIVPLRKFLAYSAGEVCGWVGVPARAAGTTLQLAHAWVGVDEACGGMRSLQAGVTAALFLGEWLRLSWPRRISLGLFAVVAAILGNFLRILFLVWRASVGGTDAVIAAHDFAGWLALISSLGLTGLAAWRLRGHPVVVVSARPAPVPRTPLPRAALVWFGTLAAIFTLIEVGTRAWYRRGAELQIAAVPHWTVRFPGRELAFHRVPLQPASWEMLHPDFFTAGEWHDHHRLISAYYVEWMKGEAALYIPFMHNPTICLPMSGCNLMRQLHTVWVPFQGRLIPFRTYVFDRNGVQFVVAFTIWNSSEGKPLLQEGERWRHWLATRFHYVANGWSSQPGQMLAVSLGGEGAEALLPGILSSLIARK